MKKHHPITLAVILVLFYFAHSLQAANIAYVTHTKTVTVTDKYKIDKKSVDIIVRDGEETISTDTTKFIIADQLRYELLSSTILTYQDVEISADSLSIPCKAKVTFQILKNGTRNLLTLKMMQKRSGTSRAWSKQLPE